jgi:predicted DNA-binding transcriptional regulator AlpA
MRIRDFQERLAATTPPAAPPPRSAEAEVFVPYADLKSHGVSYTRVHLRRLVDRKLFPAPVMLSANRIAWRLSDIVTWKATRPSAA